MKTIGTFMKVAVALICMVSFTTAFAGPPTWTRVDYTNTTAFVGEVQINAYDAGFPVTVVDGDYIGAFVNGECRMIAQIFTYNGKLYVSSVIHGGDLFDSYPSNDPLITNSQELIEFRVWDNSATAQVNRTVKGTLKATPGGEVLDYIIGKPNTDSQLASLTVTGVTLVPAFSAAQTTYTVSMPAGSTLPALAAYTATVADSRATVTVTPATNFTTGNITTVVVTAEDGTKTTYTITFTEQPCTVLAPTVTTPVQYCQGATASALTATAFTGSNLKWYTVATGGAASTVAPIPSTAIVGSTTYYVSQTTTCESPRAAIVVTIKATPSAPVAGSNSPICQGETLNLTASTITGATYAWSGTLYTNATQNPSIANATPNNAGTYTVTATVNGCTSTAGTVTVVVNATPVTPTTTSPIALNLGDPSPSLTAAVTDGGTITWYNASNTQVGTGSPYATGISTATEGNYTFSVSNKIGTCESAKVPVSVTVSGCTAAAPTVTTPVEYCQGATATALTATGSNLKWYTVASGGTELPAAPIPSTATVGSTTYYVSQTTTCESPRAAIVVTIKETPAAPTAGSNSPICQGQTLNLTASTISGATYAWSGTLYTNATQNPSIANATPNNAGTYTVTATVNGCTSTAGTVTVVVNATPVTPTTTSPIALNLGDPSPSLTAAVTDGGTITWYNASNTQVGTGSPYATGISTATEGNYTFSVSNKIGTCESAKVPVSVTVSGCTAAAPTVTTPVEYCQGATATALTATGSNLKWYTVASGGTELPAAPIPSTATVGSTTYYVSQTTTCESPRAAIVVTIKETPAAPIAGSNSPICQGQTLNLTASTITGATYAWSGTLYTNTTQNPSIANATPNNAGTYTVTATVNGCTSTAGTVTVVVNAIPSAPQVQNVTAIAGQTIPNLTAQGENLTWYESAQLTAGVQTQSFATGKTAPGTYTYYVTQKVSNCESAAAEISLTIECAITAPTLVKSQESVCQGSSYTFTAIITSGNFAVWTNEQGTVVGNSATYTTSTAGTYYVKQQNASATCISETTAATLFVKPLPAAPQTTNVSVCEGNQGSLSIGATASWYQNQTDVNALYNGLTFSPNVTNAGTYNYYVSEVLNGCEGPKALVTYTIEAKPSITVNDVIVTFGASVPDLSVTTAAQNTVNWYESNKTIFIQSGTSYASGQTAIGVYTYYVEAVSPLQCASAKTAITLQITDCNLTAPIVSSTNSNVCAGSTNPTLQATAAENVRWYSDAALTQIVSNSAQFTPADSEPGTYTYYAVQYAACVSPAKSISYTINALPNPQIFAASTVKTTDAPITITVSPLGGSLLGSGLQGTTFVPSSVIPGTYNIQYSYTDANQCTKAVIHTIQVIQEQTVDRTQLGDTLLRANAIYAQYSENPLYSSAAKIELQNAITIGQFYYNNYLNYDNTVMLEQTLALSNAITAFLQSYNPVTVNTDALEAKIIEANATYNANLPNVGTNPGQYPASSFIELQNQINIAQNKVDNPPATQLEVDNAVIVLQNAIDAFIATQVPNPAVESITTTPTLVKLVINETHTPQVVYAPVGSSGTIQWVSSNTSIATVIAGTGLITAKAKGTTSITGTLLEDPSKTVTVVVQVSGTPALTSATMNNLGNKIILEFTEPMSEPSASIYTDIQVTGVNPYFYTVTNAERDPSNMNVIILSLGSVIDNPSLVSVVYSGNSLQSEAGANVQSFNTKLTVDIDVIDVNILVYPTVTSSKVTLVGVGQADVIKLISSNGQVVLSETVNGDTQEIDVTALAQGSYTILVMSKNTILVKASCIKK
ncbi:MAG: Bacterial Ig-like domain (group 2) [Bacteroidetes bacterium ADurb.Bin217]|nr:MAG: Bacterial Ig-like domain (group 2) [Bacteroidetes bacterium ADurb.Bin217]